MKRIIILLPVLSAAFLALSALAGCKNAADSNGKTVGTVSLDTDMQTHSPADLAGCRIGCLSGGIEDLTVQQAVPDAQIVYVNSNPDAALALESGKIDAYMADKPVAELLTRRYPGHYIYCLVADDNLGFIFPKSESGENVLRSQVNEYLNRIKEDGTLDEIREIWLGTDESLKTVDFSGLSGENGTVDYAVCSTVGEPFVYIKDGGFAGYDVDIAVRFCREYGYALRISDSDFSGLMMSVTVGKCDFGASAISITEERKESLDFSDPNYVSGRVLVTKNGTAAAGGNTGFFRSFRESFEKTFIREDRWKLFLSGVGTTLLITALSAVFGTMIGFFVYLIFRRGNKFVNALIRIISDILTKTPVVLILMILYYLIFDESDINGIWVSVIGFSLIFSCAVTGLLRTAVGAIDGGQLEAALSLGYTDTRAFLRMILPQAIRHFLPGYQSEIVTLIKSTAIVGYIAVQDLTKVSDIIRGRTYEAFFPLIAGAAIYFAAAWLLIFLIRGIRLKTDPERRGREEILRGIVINNPEE